MHSHLGTEIYLFRVHEDSIITLLLSNESEYERLNNSDQFIKSFMHYCVKRFCA